MLTRREFIRLSGGAAAGAALAGLGFSVAPRPAHAITGVEEALLGAGVLGLMGLLGVSLGYKTYSDIENGTADSVGRAFGAYLSDAANESAIVAAAGADAATVVGAGYSEAQLKEAYARGAWADGLAQSITSTGAGALDWLNARTMDAALAWGALKAYFGLLGNYPVIKGMPQSAFVGDVPAYALSLGYSNFITDKPSDVSFYAAPVLIRYDGKLNGIADYVFGFPSKPVIFTNSSAYDSYSGSALGVFSNSIFAKGMTAYYGTYSNQRKWYTVDHFNSWTDDGFMSDSFDLSNVSNTVIDPARDKAIDTPQSIDPASWGFGVPVIGTDAVINGDTLQSTGHMLAPGTVGELTSDGTMSIPWSDIVWGAGLGLGDASARGIEGDAALPLGVPIPADIPVTVSVPVSDTAYGEKTMTLEDALSTGIETSISRPIDTPIPPVEGTPFYPVPVPGSDVSIPSGLPFSDLHWEAVFPFNMIYSLTDWISKNL